MALDQVVAGRVGLLLGEHEGEVGVAVVVAEGGDHDLRSSTTCSNQPAMSSRILRPAGVSTERPGSKSEPGSSVRLSRSAPGSKSTRSRS